VKTLESGKSKEGTVFWCYYANTSVNRMICVLAVSMLMPETCLSCAGEQLMNLITRFSVLLL
jgi:hypothetical protein